MRVAALVSGGKDSCFNMMHAVKEGHTIVSLINLQPNGVDELDSYMYQTVGHDAIGVYADAMDLPLFRRYISGSSVITTMDYDGDQDDEVEDLYKILKHVREKIHFNAVSVGAILSNYQRLRVENVCSRLELTPLAYLWRRDQTELLDEMLANDLEAVIIKVASYGLGREHLGKSLAELRVHLNEAAVKCGVNVCGEGGEYETFTLDCPLFKKRIVLDRTSVVVHRECDVAPTLFLQLNNVHLESKSPGTVRPVENFSILGSGALVDRIFRTCDQMGLPIELPESFPSKTESFPPNDSSLVVRRTPNTFSYMTISSDFKIRNPVLAMESVLELLELELKMINCTLDSVLYVHLYLDDLSNFDEMNAVYRQRFKVRPPARVCVELSLLSRIQLDCIVSNGLTRQHNSLHIQSVSHWAPANIGPYSQATWLDDVVFVAGQIPLVPGTMVPIHGFGSQALLGLTHVESVLGSLLLELSDLVLLVCHVTCFEGVNVARAVLDRASPDSTAKLLVLVVPRLPRDVHFEWQAMASSGVACDSTTHDSATGPCRYQVTHTSNHKVDLLKISVWGESLTNDVILLTKEFLSDSARSLNLSVDFVRCFFATGATTPGAPLDQLFQWCVFVPVIAIDDSALMCLVVHCSSLTRASGQSIGLD